MRFLKDDGSYQEMKCVDIKQTININYELIDSTSQKLYSIDRGTQSDRYSAVFTFRGTREYIREVVTSLNELRRAKKAIVVDEFGDRYFGDNVDHTGTITCMFDNEPLSEITNVKYNVHQFSLNLIATGLSFTGSAILPTGMGCIQTEYQSYSLWDTTTNETYYRDVYFTDNTSDIYIFKGTYMLSLEDNEKLQAFWKTYRGDEVSVNESAFGTQYMFGPDGGTGQHIVIITSLVYEIISPILRKVIIELVKVG
jgi:hypothetical protein